MRMTGHTKPDSLVVGYLRTLLTVNSPTFVDDLFLLAFPTQRI